MVFGDGGLAEVEVWVEPLGPLGPLVPLPLDGPVGPDVPVVPFEEPEP